MIDGDGKRKKHLGNIFGNDFSILLRSRTLHDLGAYMTLMECGARDLVVLWVSARMAVVWWCCVDLIFTSFRRRAGAWDRIRGWEGAQ